jgi:Holliday junction DNA helicase RuvB
VARKGTPAATPPIDSGGESGNAIVDALAPAASALDKSLRPQKFAEFVGQREVVENLSLAIRAAKARGEAIDHVLLSGLPGLGKTTLAHLIARECGVGFKETSGPAIQRAADLAGLLTNLETDDVLFIDEVHRLPPAVEEYLYAAMEQFVIDVMIDQGPGARSLRIDLPRFTLVGATTREGLLSAPFRGRFGLVERLEVYPVADLATILARSARVLGVGLDPDAGMLLATMSRGTPRVANRFLKRVRDLAQVTAGNRITRAVAEDGLRRLGVDENGLLRVDRLILEVLAHAGGAPVGLKTVAAAVGEDERTIEDVYEPHLLRSGLLAKTPQGRRATPRGHAALGLPPPAGAYGASANDAQAALPFA